MKKHYLIFLILITLFYSCKEEKQVEDTIDTISSIYYFIRHAEKDRTDSANKDPHLTERGNSRAQHWSDILMEVKFDAIYSTDYNRTRETALPTAIKNNLELILYNPNEINAKSFLEATKGKTVLVVGHSNTTPAFVNKILGTNKYQDIDDNNNGNLYIVTVTGNHIIDQLLVIN